MPAPESHAQAAMSRLFPSPRTSLASRARRPGRGPAGWKSWARALAAVLAMVSAWSDLMDADFALGANIATVEPEDEPDPVDDYCRIQRGSPTRAVEEDATRPQLSDPITAMPWQSGRHSALNDRSDHRRGTWTEHAPGLQRRSRAPG